MGSSERKGINQNMIPFPKPIGGTFVDIRCHLTPCIKVQSAVIYSGFNS